MLPVLARRAAYAAVAEAPGALADALEAAGE